jgi:hypothetical protein
MATIRKAAVKRALVLAFCFFAVGPTPADVGIRVADYPAKVLSYSPVFITGVVENYGSEPVLIPASSRSDCRYFIEIGSTREDLKELMPYNFDVGSIPLVWLKPGESWFFHVEIGRWLPLAGSSFIRLGLRSTGECLFRPQGDETFPLKLLYENPSVKVYECWAGRVMSDTVTIDFVVPDSVVDREAMDFLRSPESGVAPYLKNNLELPLEKGASHLWERFPSSHYNYAAAFSGCMNSPECLQKLLDLQPSHPLAPYTSFQKGLASISSGRGEEVSLQALDIPSALKDYLVQEKAAEEQRQRRAVSHQAARPD